MPRRSFLPVTPKPRRHFSPFWEQKCFNLVASYRRPLMAGCFDGRTRIGTAFGQSGRATCPWMWERRIERGYWAGQRYRRRWEGD